MKHAGISIVLLLACQSAQASAQVLEFSAGASAVVDQLKISNQRFRPVVASLEMALNHRENGIGLELHLGRGISEDDAVGVDIDVLQQHSLYVTFTNTYQGKYRVWLGAGYSLLELAIVLAIVTGLVGLSWPVRGVVPNPSILTPSEDKLR